MSNIDEGFERGCKAEFRRFLAMAKGSAGEVRSQLYVALDGGHLDRPSFDLLYAQTESVSSLIGGPMRYLSHTSHP
jgi:four helix bundle protein